MANNKVALELGLNKVDDGWIDRSGSWKVEKAHHGYLVSHIPSGRVQACVGIKTLEGAVRLMKDENLDNQSYFRAPEPAQVSTPRPSVGL